MKFGQRVRDLRHDKGWSLRDLAAQVGVGFTYLSRVENERLNFGDYPSEALIHRLADALDEGELTSNSIHFSSTATGTSPHHQLH